MRFPEFEGEWNESTLNTLCDKIGDGLHGTPSYSKGSGYYFINGNNLLNGEVNISNNTKEVTQLDWARHNKNLNDKTLFITINGTIGNVAKYGNQNLMLGKSVAYLNFKEHRDFFYFVLVSSNIQKYFISELTGTTIKNLSLKTIRDTKIFYPFLNEQKKISSFLGKIDSRIQTQSKIIEQLKSLISGLKDAIFLKKIKFNSLQENWRTYKVSDLLEFFSTNSLSWENLEYGTEGTHNLHYGIIHKSNSPRLDLTKQILPSIKSEFTSNKFSLCRDGDIVFADASEDTNDIGKAIEFVNCNDKKVVSGLHTIHGRDKLTLTIVGFKGFAFTASKFRNQIKRLGQGTKVYSISEKNFKDCSIDIPPISEQVKITGILTYIDEKLITETDLLRKLNKQKDALLKELFI
ncbi:MAG: restriction endonuclease subunit S [Pedobacter sp.]|nr:MAG: restriction endonuclease subunit S [Pedobacter sp.]